MKLQILCLLTTLYLYSADNSFDNRSRQVETLQSLCPEVNICHETGTTNATNAKFKNVTESCCTECSCQQACTETGNCCFPEDLRHKQRLEPQSHLEFECLFPTSFQPPADERVYFNSYRMVSSVHNTNGNKNQTLKCGDEKVAPWGSLYPVYSPVRKMIYKNMACADADNVGDGVAWDVILVCKRHIDVPWFDANIPFHWINSGANSDVCRLYFTYNGTDEDIKPLKCFVDPISTCNGKYYQIPPGLGMSADEIREACTSGPWSPYRKTMIYRNIFCLICNNGSVAESSTCRKVLDDPPRSASSTQFVGLLDVGTLRESTQSDVTSQSPQLSCFKSKGKECVEVFCPSGQLKTKGGRCRFLSKLWYAQEYELYIELTVDNTADLKLDTIFGIQPGLQTRGVLSDLISPWSKSWVISNILVADDTLKQNVVTKIYVEQRARFSNLNPANLISYIEKTINRDWKLRSDNKIYTLTSRFMNRKYYDGNSSFIIGNESRIIPRTKLHNVYTSWSLPTSMLHTITKLYTCNQVELQPSDFVWSHDNRSLFNTITGKVLYMNEFTPVYRPLGSVHVRVCLEDSGFYQAGYATSSLGFSLFGDHIVTCYIVVKVLMMTVFYDLY